MRKYIVRLVDETLEFDAEMDSLDKGCMILSKKKQFEGEIARVDVKPEIVAIFSLANLRFYTYTEHA